MSSNPGPNLEMGHDCFPSYEVDAVVFYGDPTRIYRARHRPDGKPVMLKTLRDERAAREASAWLKHEFEITRRIKAPGVIQVYDLERHNNLPVMVLEDFGGDSLDNLARQRRIPIEELLRIAIQLAEGLNNIHSANVIHKDINPSNIVYNPATGMVKIIDFGISTYLTREQAALSSPQVFEGSLPYISPEQTGRMNRSIDYRTDFYSLGVTLYELLTGRPLFIVTEPIEWFHYHIAKQPVPPAEINAAIPRPVSEIVMRLLSKTAEGRYQSAKGIQEDLEHCLEELANSGDIAPFPLGSKDVSDRFQIPQRLYGRDREVAQLLSAFERVGLGDSEIILVSGYSGIGKTCLIKEIYKPITERHGHFISGKFDQLHRNIPYSALAAALRDLVRQLLTESEEQLAEWRTKIQDAVGTNGRLLIDIIQELELIIGPQPEVEEVKPLEAEQRFHRAFHRFIQVFCTPRHPLAIFLDDLQWADSASMRLIDVLTDPESGTTHLLLIGAYRDNEVHAAHPVTLWLRDIAEKNVALDAIALQPLGRDDLTALICDTLDAAPNNVAPLVDIVMNKTAGNPFFTEEFLKALHHDGLISFSQAQRSWIWDTARISARQMADNVVELMTEKLQQLSPESKSLIELGACIGFRFHLNVLAMVSNEMPNVIARRLRGGITEGLIAPIGDAYQLLELEQSTDLPEITVEFAFSHDRIRQAAYTLLDKSRRQQAHYKIGRLLQKHLPPLEFKERLFEITDHLNLGSVMITAPTERTTLCRLNLQAGKRAKIANAYRPAHDYFQKALTLLDNGAWQQDYPLALELHVEAAEAAYLAGDYESMDRILTTGFAQTRDLLDKEKLYLIHISACMARGKLLEAIHIAKGILAKLGHHYPDKPNKLHVIIKLLRLKWYLRNKRVRDLQKLPEMTDPRHLAAMKLGSHIGGAAMFAQPDLLTLMILRAAKTSFVHGHAPQSLTTYAALGAIFAEALGDVGRGNAFGQMALELLTQPNIKADKGRVLHVYNTLVRHWKEPLRNCIEPLKEAYQVCLEEGDFEYAAHAACVRLAHALEISTDLKTISEEMLEFYDALKPLKQGPRIQYLTSMLQKIDNLMGNSDDPSVLKGRYYDADRMQPLNVQSSDKSLIITDRLNQMLLCYLFGKHQEALSHTRHAKNGVQTGLRGMYFSLPFTMLDALIRLANFSETKGRARRRLLRQVAADTGRLKRWAKVNPANGLNKLKLVQAERLRVAGRELEAHQRYDESIRLARENSFTFEEALAYELCGTMHFEAGRQIIGQTYLAGARDLYRDWGARAKVDHLEQSFPQIIERVRRSSGNTSNLPTHLDSVDIGLLMKALKAIADEKVHSRMVEIIITTAIEFASAQQGTLILRNAEGTLCIEAEASVDGEKPRILQSSPIMASDLPQTIINYVSRTRTSVVIHDAQQPSDQLPGLEKDPHILAHSVRSVLCLPIQSGNKEQNELIGMLYLENNHVCGTFTQERFDTLEIICLSAAGRLELSRKAVIDGLTGLYNHDYFQSLLRQEFSSTRRHGRDLAILLIDIDHFKRFNDTWGHQVGDKVLREVAHIIKASCRSEDTVARYGGEEMAVILPLTNRENARIVAERIRRSIEKHRIRHDNAQLNVTISLGLAIMGATIADKDALIRHADMALYKSKAEGRNRLTIA